MKKFIIWLVTALVTVVLIYAVFHLLLPWGPR